MAHNASGDITAAQIKASRAALGLSIHEIASVTGIGVATLKRYEATSGVPNSRKGHLSKLKAFLEENGIEFIGTPDDGPGIRIRAPKS